MRVHMCVHTCVIKINLKCPVLLFNTHSVTYGINRASPLLMLSDFDITKSLPFDVMHTIYEGIASYHLNLLFTGHLIDDYHYFTLDQLNHIIKVHPYGYTECDTKPSPIHRESTLDY